MKIYLTDDADKHGIRCIEAEYRTCEWLPQAEGRWFDEDLESYTEGVNCELTEAKARAAIRDQLFAEYDRCTKRASVLHGLLKNEAFPGLVKE